MPRTPVPRAPNYYVAMHSLNRRSTRAHVIPKCPPVVIAALMDLLSLSEPPAHGARRGANRTT